MEKTLVIFRKFKDDGSIIALFPEEIADHKGNCMSYMHVGQHSAADYNGLMTITVPANPVEHRALRQELENIGYRLNVKLRCVRKRSAA
jgi:hypothetical protein